MPANGNRPDIRAIAIGAVALFEQLVAELIERFVDWAKACRADRRRKP
jgi:hypothetical protein